MQDSKTNVGNGKAYAVCTCDGPESETKSKCAFKTEDLAQAAIACDEGYTVKVGMSEAITMCNNGNNACQQRLGVCEGFSSSFTHLLIDLFMNVLQRACLST